MIHHFAIDHRFRAGNGVLFVVADENRLRGKAQIHRSDGDRQRRPPPRPAALALGRAHQGMRQLRRRAVSWRIGSVGDDLLLGAASLRFGRCQSAGRAVDEKFIQRAEIFRCAGQIAVDRRHEITTRRCRRSNPTSRSPCRRPWSVPSIFQRAADFFDAASRVRRAPVHVNGFFFVRWRQSRRRAASGAHSHFPCLSAARSGMAATWSPNQKSFISALRRSPRPIAKIIIELAAPRS